MRDLTAYRGRPYRFIGRYVLAYPLSHAAITLAVVAAVFCSVSTQYGVKYLVDALSAGGSHHKVWIGFLALATLIALDNLLWRVASWIANSVFVDVTGRVRKDLFSHLTGHAPSYFSNRSPGALTSRVSSTSNAIFTGEMMFTFNVLPPLAATFLSIGYLASVSVAMAVALTIAGALIGWVIFRYASRARPLLHAYANEAAAVDGQMVDVVSNMTLVKAFGRLSFEHRRLRGVVGKEMIARKRSLYYLERLRIAHAVVTSILTFCLLAWVINLWSHGEATPGDVVLVCTLGMAVLSATRDLAVALVDVMQHLARLSEAVHTLLEPHGLRDAKGPGPEKTSGQIEFRNVTFSYPNSPPALNGISLKIESGEKVGIVGPSGGGKSTLLALIQHFYEPEEGAVLVNGKDVRTFPDLALRRAISVVSQEVPLLHRTLRENIAYGRPRATMEEIWQAAEAARCAAFIGALPDGLETVVGDRGAKISGGQRQRIAIARAFLRDAPILLLDEATSALDPHAEELVRQALQHLMRGRTVLAIAHRLTTIRNFQRIIVLDRGAVIEDGDPEELMSRGGVYKALVDLELERLSRMHTVSAAE